MKACKYCGDEEVVARQESGLKGSRIPHSKEDEYTYICSNCMAAYTDGHANGMVEVINGQEDPKNKWEDYPPTKTIKVKYSGLKEN